jgi:hypothetical protein
LEPNNGRKKLRARNLRHKVLGYCVLKELWPNLQGKIDG